MTRQASFGDRDDLVTHTHLCHARTHTSNDARTFAAKRGGTRIKAEDVQHVAKVQPGGACANFYLTRGGRLPHHRREFQLVRRSALAHDERVRFSRVNQ